MADPTPEQREAAEKFWKTWGSWPDNAAAPVSVLAQLLAEREVKLMSALEDAIDTIAVYKAEKENDYVSLEEVVADSDEGTT